MTDDTSPNLGLTLYQTKENEFEVQHNDALVALDALVMLAVIDRDHSAPPVSPSAGDRYLVKATGTGAFAGKDGQIAQRDINGWDFHVPREGWTCYVQDESTLLAWDGDSWEPALNLMSSGAELQNVAKLGVGTTADATNPLSAKLNNVLWTAKTVAEGGDGDLRYKLSKESAAKTASFLFQNNFSGRAEIGLTGDDDFHFKTSPDGTAWIDALLLDKTTGAAKVNAGFFLTGDLTPSQITSDQNDYNPAGLATASVLRLSSDASRNVTGLSGGGDGRVIGLLNVGSHPVVLSDASASSSAANRFSFGADLTLLANQSVVLIYDATSSRWRLFGGAGGGAARPGVNRLINGGFRFDQRNGGSSAAISDGGYCLDRWYALTQTASINVSQLSDPEDGYLRAIRLTQNQATAQRMGFAQAIEGSYCKDMRGKSGTLSLRLRISNAQAIRYAILAHTGTEDSPTRDVVNDWTSGAYTAGNFFIGSNLSVLAVGAQTPAANTWTTLAALTAALGTSFNNLILFVWTEGTAAQNVTLDADFVQFEEGVVASAFERRPHTLEEALCGRYFQVFQHGFGVWTSASLAQIALAYDPPMRTAPSASVTAAMVITDMLIADRTQSSAAVSAATGMTEKAGRWNFTNFSGATALYPAYILGSGGKLHLSAEL